MIGTTQRPTRSKLPILQMRKLKCQEVKGTQGFTAQSQNIVPRPVSFHNIKRQSLVLEKFQKTSILSLPPKSVLVIFPLPSWKSKSLVIRPLQIFILSFFSFFTLSFGNQIVDHQSLNQIVFLIQADTVISQQRVVAGLEIRMSFLLTIIVFSITKNDLTFQV